MSKLPRWPWSRTPPGEVLSTADDIDHQARLEDAEHELALARVQKEKALEQVGAAHGFLERIRPVIKQNQIGPSVEQSFRRNSGRR